MAMILTLYTCCTYLKLFRHKLAMSLTVSLRSRGHQEKEFCHVNNLIRIIAHPVYTPVLASAGSRPTARAGMLSGLREKALIYHNQLIMPYISTTVDQKRI